MRQKPICFIRFAIQMISITKQNSANQSKLRCRYTTKRPSPHKPTARPHPRLPKQTKVRTSPVPIKKPHRPPPRHNPLSICIRRFAISNSNFAYAARFLSRARALFNRRVTARAFFYTRAFPFCAVFRVAGNRLMPTSWRTSSFA